MPTHPPIPPLLQPYLSPPPSGSLTLLTGTLSATTNWLVLRFLASILRESAQSGNDDITGRSDCIGQTKVVLVSWLREPNFWRDGGRKLGINFQHITLINGVDSPLGFGSTSLPDLERELLTAFENPQGPSEDKSSTALVLDGLDFVLAATGCLVSEMMSIILTLRGKVGSTIITANADSSLLHAQTTPLEFAHAAFTMELAHQARMVMSARDLDTGGAGDVSGVLRTTRGGEVSCEEVTQETEEKECLYQVFSDGSVRVFERGT